MSNCKSNEAKLKWGTVLQLVVLLSCCLCFVALSGLEIMSYLEGKTTVSTFWVTEEEFKVRRYKLQCKGFPYCDSCI